MPTRRRSPLRPPSKPAVRARPAPAEGEIPLIAEAGDAVRLHKALADAGIGSRREMEAWIAEGRVTVNGETAHVGQRVTSNDVIKVSGRRVYLRAPETKRVRVLIYHKQEGEIVSRDDPKGRATVFEQLPRIRGAKWVSVGRLDFNTEGLMIFTTSGELANRLMHPRFEVEREYAVRVLGELTPQMQEQLLGGVELEDGEARVESLSEAGGEGANRWWRVVIREGRYREVRRLFDAVGVKVSRLIRTRYGPVALPPQLKRGQKHELDETEVKRLLRWADMPIPDSRPRSPGRAAPRKPTSGRAGKSNPTKRT
ncbi:MAG: pseudouridine synthase [Pseudomonadota bacterium]